MYYIVIILNTITLRKSFLRLSKVRRQLPLFKKIRRNCVYNQKSKTNELKLIFSNP
jgi:predicted dithiol-disulfide oxidoreductase (DUF899 family)